MTGLMDGYGLGFCGRIGDVILEGVFRADNETHAWEIQSDNTLFWDIGRMDPACTYVYEFYQQARVGWRTILNMTDVAMKSNKSGEPRFPVVSEDTFETVIASSLGYIALTA